MDMNKASFKVFYDGEALSSGAMNVRDLAPALLAFGDLLESTNKVINGEKSQVSVNIKSFPGGCFGIDLEVCMSIKQQIVSLFSGEDVTAAVNILTLLGLTRPDKGLVRLIRAAKGRWPKKATKLESGNVTLEFDDGELIEAEERVVALFQDIPVRQAFEKTLSPLDADGIDSFYTEDGGVVVHVATKVERPYFDIPEVPDKKLFEDSAAIRVLSIHSLSFKDGNKWHMSDGANNFWATITDQNFLRAVDNNQSFSKGDRMKVNLITRQWETGRGQLKTEYEIDHVLEHTRAMRQIPLS